MTIDINELRRLMQDFKLAGSPMLVQTAQMSELLDRLEAAEKSDAESIAMYRKARDERDTLRAKIEAMERQAPVAWAAKLALEYGASRLGFRGSSVNMWGENGVPLYTLPGAKGE